MKFTVPFAVLASALAVSAAPVAPEAAELEPRQANPYAVAFISSAASALVSKAVDEAVGLIGDISDWNGVCTLSTSMGLTDELTTRMIQAREKFTQKTTDAMWQSRPSQAGAAVCYNKAYVVSNRNSMSDLTSVELKKGPLHTEYVRPLFTVATLRDWCVY